MKISKVSGAMFFCASVLAMTTLPATAETLTIWSRSAAADPAQGMIDLWNSKHEDKIELTVIPNEEMVTKLATAVQAGDGCRET